MTPESTVELAFKRNAKALSLRPTLGIGTATTTVRVRNGLTCEIEDGPWKLTADMGEKQGGGNQGPNPGVLGRGALGSCLAMSYVMWAAHLGLPIDGLEVEIQADYDAGAAYGVSDATPAYLQVRYIVTVETDAPKEEVIQFLNEVDARTPYLRVFADPQELRREVRVMAPRR